MKKRHNTTGCSTKYKLINQYLRIDTGPQSIQAPRNTIASDVFSLLKEGYYSDLEIIVNEKTIKVHNVILETRCPQVLKFIEPQSFNKLYIKNPKYTFKIVMAALEFIYSDYVHIYDKTQNEDLNSLAEEWGLTKLQLLIQQKSVLNGHIESSPQFTRDIGATFDNKTFSDFTIMSSITKRIFYTHKCLLSVRSNYFKMLISSGMKEAISGVLTLDVDEKLLECILRYVSSGVVQIDPPELSVELLSWAHKVDMPILVNLCEITIGQNFDFQDIDSVITLLQLADLHQASNLLHLCTYLLLYEFGISTVKKQESYSILSQDLKRKLNEYNNL